MTARMIHKQFTFDERNDRSWVRRISIRDEQYQDRDYMVYEILKILEKRDIHGEERETLAVLLYKMFSVTWKQVHGTGDISTQFRAYLLSPAVQNEISYHLCPESDLPSNRSNHVLHQPHLAPLLSSHDFNDSRSSVYPYTSDRSFITRSLDRVEEKENGEGIYATPQPIAYYDLPYVERRAAAVAQRLHHRYNPPAFRPPHSTYSWERHTNTHNDPSAEDCHPHLQRVQTLHSTDSEQPDIQSAFPNPPAWPAAPVNSAESQRLFHVFDTLRYCVDQIQSISGESPATLRRQRMPSMDSRTADQDQNFSARYSRRNPHSTMTHSSSLLPTASLDQGLAPNLELMDYSSSEPVELDSSESVDDRL